MSKDLEINNHKKFTEKDDDTQFQVDECYRLGTDIAKDETKAFEYYKKSAEKGHDMNQSVLGCLYKNGEGTEKDLEKNIYWYNEAAKNGNKLAQYIYLEYTIKME